MNPCVVRAARSWRKLGDETDASLALYSVPYAASAYYRCIALGTPNSSVVASQDSPGVGSTGSLTLSSTDQANLDVTYTAGVGAGPWTFQWYFNGQLISGATASQYTAHLVDCTQTGTYRVEAQDGCGKSFQYPASSEANLYRAGCP
jgi:hypothetical protein